MAELHRTTTDEVVSYFLEGEGVDVLRQSLLWVCQAEVSELVGAERGERAPRERTPAPKRLPAAGVAHPCGGDRVGDPQAPAGKLLPLLSGAAPPLRAGARERDPGGLCRRCLYA